MEVVDNVLGFAGKKFPEFRILRSDAHRARVEMAFAHHDAAHRHQRRGSKAELVGSEQRGEGHVAPRLELPIALDPNDARAYSHRGLAYYRKGEYERAIADHSKAIAIDPNDANAYYNRGVAYEQKGDKDQAIADFRKVLEINPSDQDAKVTLELLGVTP